MNTGEERSLQKLQDALEALNLSGRNMELAEKYLDMEQEEDRSLLSGVEHQDLSGFRLSPDQLKQCRDYTGYCLKRNRKEAHGRFVRFSSAVGGSTAYYVLVSYGWNINTILEYLTREQAAAIRAEGIVWNQYGLKHVLNGIVQKTPQVLRDAMELCYHRHDNAKSLLAALSLYYTKPEKPAGGVIKALFPGGKTERQAQDQLRSTVHYLEKNLTDSIENMFEGSVPSEEELKKLTDFVQHSSLD